MTAPITTKAQAQAYRYGVRRIENAVATGDSLRRVTGGPRHGLSFLIGVLLAVLGLAGFAVFALISPAPSIGDAKVVVDGDNGGAYVVRGGRLYPALNYASALLAAGRDTTRSGSGAGSGSAAGAGKPKSTVIDADTVDDTPKGQTLGIAGAPAVVPTEDDLVSGSWTVCDAAVQDPAKAPSSPPDITTYVLLGRPVATLPAGVPATLVSADGGRTTFLLADGHRAKVDTTNRAIGIALDTDSATVRPVSAGLLDAIPRAADVVPPEIRNAGASVPWSETVTVGSVFQVRFASGTAYYIALDDGAERVPRVVADLVRANAGTTAGIPAIPPSQLKAAPVSDAVDLSRYPSQRPVYYTAGQQPPVLCLDWTGGRGDGSYQVYPAESVPLPDGAKAVPAPPGSPATTADQVYLAPGRGQVLGQVVGDQAASAGALFLVGDNGVKYPVVSPQALHFLGLGKHVRAAPPSLVGLLPTGPVLDPAAAARYFPGRSGN